MARDRQTDDRSLRTSRFAPYAMSFPGVLWLYLFILVPMVTLLKIALSVKPNRNLPHYDFTWEWGNFSTAFTDFGEQLVRSFVYAAIATVLCVLIAYPIAYFIAFKAGKWRNLMLGLVMVPFFTSFLLRTIAWQSLFADNGPILDWFVEPLHLTGVLDFLHITTDGKIINTESAVIGGLT